MTETLPVVRVEIESIFPDPANARIHDSRNLDAIKHSLARFGQQKPIVVMRSNGMILAGNGTWEAARQLGWSHIDVRYSELEGIEATAYALADNRTAELATWDFEAVSTLLKAIDAENGDIKTLGWSDYELEPLLQADWNPPALAPLEGTDEDSSSSEPSETKQITFTALQWDTVGVAIERWRAINDNVATDEARILELICADYLQDE